MSKGRTRNTDVPGNTIASHAAYVRQLVRQAETLLSFEAVLDQMFDEEVYVTGITIRCPDDDRHEYLAVVRVQGADGKQVGFHNAPTFEETIIGVINRLKNKSMKFKEDMYG